MLTCDAYLTPATVGEALAAIAAARGRCRVVAGATDILPWAREGRAGDVHIPVLIDVTRIAELNVRETIGNDRLRLGAATPIERFVDDPSLVAAMPVMPRMAVWFADDQIREQATIGGNLVNASPAADATPALLLHDGIVELAGLAAGREKRRCMPLTEFLQGPGVTALGDGELVAAIECEPLVGYGAAFEKVGHRRSLVISTVCLAAAVKLDAGARCFADVRLAVGGIGPKPQRLHEVERFLAADAISADRLMAAAEMPVALVASRTRQEYRREVVRGFVLRALVAAARRAGAGIDVIPQEIEAAYA